jgi:hypothetical protein
MPSAFMGILTGAAAAYMLDPQQGRRRRAVIRDRALKTYRETREFADAASRDLRNHAQGVKAHPASIISMARGEFTQRNWSPAARVVSGGGGSALMLFGFARGGVLGLLAFIAGAAALARAGANKPLGELARSLPHQQHGNPRLNLSTTEAKE